jgi:predicted Zn-dependent protease
MIDIGKLAQALRNRMHEIVADEAIYRSYQRHQEYEADAAAVRALYATGYDPSQAADVFEELRKLHRGRADVSLCIASTHPQFDDRIKRIHALASGHGRRPRKPDSSDFRRLMEAMA